MDNDFETGGGNEEDEDTDDEDEDGLEAGMDSEEGAKHRQAILDSSDLSAQEKVSVIMGDQNYKCLIFEVENSK